LRVSPARHRAAVGNVPCPVQATGGADDPAMTLTVYGGQARAAAGPAEVAAVPGSTFRRKTRRQPSHGRSLSRRRGLPEPFGKE
jgi:hypothetical protein